MPLYDSRHTVEDVASDVMRARADHRIEGVTFSGGEPMQQATALSALLRVIRSQAPKLSFGMFSGYTEDELTEGRYWTWDRRMSPKRKRGLWEEIHSQLDFAVLGRFNCNPAAPHSAPAATRSSDCLAAGTCDRISASSRSR